ncbi:MAG: hypothetical protein KDI42_04515, partial [Gammaproteobacteria bacterium]|nr:hypothetical protein [Gammaproteobacteria bacterium]
MPAFAAELKTHVEADAAGFDLRFAKPVQVSREARDGGWVLRFSQPLDADLDAAASTLKLWVASMWGGFDSLLIKPQPGTEVDFTVDDHGVRVALHRRLVAPEAAKPTVAQPNPRQQLRLARLEAIWLVENGRIHEAVLALRGLVEMHPNEADLRIDLAGVEARLGHWRAALEHYDQALALIRVRADARSTTDDAELAKARADLWREHAPYLRVEAWRQRFGDTEVQRVAKTDLRWLLDADKALEFEHRLVHFTENTAVRNIDGDAATFDGSR